MLCLFEGWDAALREKGMLGWGGNGEGKAVLLRLYLGPIPVVQLLRWLTLACLIYFVLLIRRFVCLSVIRSIDISRN